MIDYQPIVMLWSVAAATTAAGSAQAVKPTDAASRPSDGVIRLFNGKDLNGLATWLEDSQTEDPHGVFRVHDGVLHVSGRPRGYVGTVRAYRDYRLVVEYKWGRRTYGSKTVRNSGILLHAVGPDGNRSPWMASIECQLAQGCAGDLIPIRGQYADGATVPVRFTSETVPGPDRRPRWKPGGAARVFTRRQLWWSRHDPAFEERTDTRGRFDVESPRDEWTRVECICRGHRITVRINGTTVNECYDAFPSAGRILLQSEGFEILFRRFELHPLATAPPELNGPENGKP